MGKNSRQLINAQSVNYWIFTATPHKSDGRTFTAEEIFRQRMADKFWGLGERTPNRQNLRRGDRVAFYLGQPLKAFAGTATLTSASFELSASDQKRLAHGTELYRAPYGVWFDDIQIWNTPRKVESLLPDLKFIENPRSWGVYLQGGVRQIQEGDFRAILVGREASISEVLKSAEDIESESEFALESHLEEFLDQNWEKIKFGSSIKRYKTDDQSGRQFPAGVWSIDFLCVDQENGDYVVIELKRGKTSDATVGQLLRYMSWVKDNLAKPGQQVRGIIITREFDEALHYAVKSLPNVEVLTYRVDFVLSSAKSR